jgi:ribosomal protein S18 acetylase RimI-like enzyme
MIIKEKTTEDNSWIVEYMEREWGGNFIITNGRMHYIEQLAGIILSENQKNIGICLYEEGNNECEIVLLEAFEKNKGVGTILIKEMISRMKNMNWRRIWLITTNDNLDAIRFYQRRKFRINKINKNGIDKARKLKHTIPLVGNYGIPIHGEIEMEYSNIEEKTD